MSSTRNRSPRNQSPPPENPNKSNKSKKATNGKKSKKKDASDKKPKNKASNSSANKASKSKEVEAFLKKPTLRRFVMNVLKSKASKILPKRYNLDTEKGNHALRIRKSAISIMQAFGEFTFRYILHHADRVRQLRDRETITIGDVESAVRAVSCGSSGNHSRVQMYRSDGSSLDAGKTTITKYIKEVLGEVRVQKGVPSALRDLVCSVLADGLVEFLQSEPVKNEISKGKEASTYTTKVKGKQMTITRYPTIGVSDKAMLTFLPIGFSNHFGSIKRNEYIFSKAGVELKLAKEFDEEKIREPKGRPHAALFKTAYVNSHLNEKERKTMKSKKKYIIDEHFDGDEDAFEEAWRAAFNEMKEKGMNRVVAYVDKYLPEQKKTKSVDSASPDNYSFTVTVTRGTYSNSFNTMIDYILKADQSEASGKSKKKSSKKSKPKQKKQKKQKKKKQQKDDEEDDEEDEQEDEEDQASKPSNSPASLLKVAKALAAMKAKE